MEDPGGEFIIIQCPNKSISLAFNGEIYNWRDIRRGISTANYTFTTNDDGECIIALYQAAGISGFNALDGMFSFILWDSREEKMIIARDRHGIKPLYVCRADGELIVCSEISGIRSIKTLSIDGRAIYQYPCLNGLLKIGRIPASTQTSTTSNPAKRRAFIDSANCSSLTRT